TVSASTSAFSILARSWNVIACSGDTARSRANLTIAPKSNPCDEVSATTSPSMAERNSASPPEPATHCPSAKFCSVIGFILVSRKLRRTFFHESADAFLVIRCAAEHALRVAFAIELIGEGAYAALADQLFRFRQTARWRGRELVRQRIGFCSQLIVL